MHFDRRCSRGVVNIFQNVAVEPLIIIYWHSMSLLLKRIVLPNLFRRPTRKRASEGNCSSSKLWSLASSSTPSFTSLSSETNSISSSSSSLSLLFDGLGGGGAVWFVMNTIAPIELAGWFHNKRMVKVQPLPLFLGSETSAWLLSLRILSASGSRLSSAHKRKGISFNMSISWN